MSGRECVGASGARAVGSPHLLQTIVPVESGRRDRTRGGTAAARGGARPVRTSRSSCCRRPGLVSPDAPAIRLGLDAFERVLGVRPALIRGGGSLPIVSALAANGVPTVISGLALPDSQIHARNERLLVEYMPLGVAVARELFVAFAAL
jgi:hypothetical protein